MATAQQAVQLTARQKRFAWIAAQLAFVSANTKATQAERIWAANADSALRAAYEKELATPAATPALPFNPYMLQLGMGGEAYLQRFERNTQAVVSGILARKGQSVGVWSWNPNKWGMTQAEADAYDLAQAQLSAQLKQTNPGVLDTLQQTVQESTQTAGSVYKFLLWGGGAFLLAWGISEVIAARGEVVAAGAVRTARAARTA